MRPEPQVSMVAFGLCFFFDVSLRDCAIGSRVSTNDHPRVQVLVSKKADGKPGIVIRHSLLIATNHALSDVTGKENGNVTTAFGSYVFDLANLGKSRRMDSEELDALAIYLKHVSRQHICVPSQLSPCLGRPIFKSRRYDYESEQK